MDETDEVKGEYDRLTHPSAEAQVDYGITETVEDGKVKDIHCLIMSFSYNNGGLAVPLPTDNLECILEGLKILFNRVNFIIPNPYRARVSEYTKGSTSPNLV